MVEIEIHPVFFTQAAHKIKVTFVILDTVVAGLIIPLQACVIPVGMRVAFKYLGDDLWHAHLLIGAAVLVVLEQIKPGTDDGAIFTALVSCDAPCLQVGD